MNKAKNAASEKFIAVLPVILKDNASSSRMAAFYRGADDCDQQGGSIHLRSL
jgi:hypothetical protein